MTKASPPQTGSPGMVLVINPNSSKSVTSAIDLAVEPLRIAGGPRIEVVDLPQGPPGIMTQLDSDGVVMPLAALVKDHPADAFVIACFSDPGLHAVREAAGGRPVMGIAEWGVLRALSLGERFGVIALSPNSIKRQQRMARTMGIYSRYAGSWSVGLSAAESAQASIRDRMIEAGRALTQNLRADVVVLGCAGMASHRRAIEDAIGCPVVEPSQQAAAAAMSAILLREA
jgi:allantoin racemase